MPTMTPSEPIMTLEEAAEYLRISKAHLSNVINGKVPGVRPPRVFRAGRRILIRREWLDRWLEDGHLEATSEW
jgi:excisionase family DNA binding protein